MNIWKSVICIDNSPNDTHPEGIPINLHEEVIAIEIVGCCYKIQKENGEEYILNQNRFIDKIKSR